MSVAKVCVFVAFVLIYIPRAFVLRAQIRQPGGLDNSLPRDQQAQLPPAGKRAQGAHMNAFEAFAPFAAAVLLALGSKADRTAIDALAAAHVGLRAVYTGLYIGNVPSARSPVWVLATLVTVAIFVLGISS